MITPLSKSLTDSQYWDSFWTKAARLKKLNPFHPYFGRRGLFVKTLTQQLGQISGQTVLELGGGGHNFRLLAMRRWLGAKVTALDFSPKGLEQVQALFATNNEQVTTVSGDIFGEELKAHSGQFDLVCHWGVIEHFDPPDELLQICYDLLKPSGRLVLSIPNLNTLAANFFRKYSPENYATHIPYRSDQLQSALERNGFSQVGHSYFGYPAFQYYNWERPNALTRLLSLLHRLGIVSAWFLPYSSIGSRLWSMELLLVGRKPEKEGS